MKLLKLMMFGLMSVMYSDLNACESNSTSLIDSVVGMVARNPKTCAVVGYLVGSYAYQKLRGIECPLTISANLINAKNTIIGREQIIEIAGFGAGIESYTPTCHLPKVSFMRVMKNDNLDDPSLVVFRHDKKDLFFGIKPNVVAVGFGTAILFGGASLLA